MSRMLPVFYAAAAIAVWPMSAMGQDTSPTNRDPKECRRDLSAATRYFKNSSCYGFVLVCNECVYGEGGKFEKQSSSICGACLGLRI